MYYFISVITGLSLLVLGCSTSEIDKVDSQTHWLATCNADDDCGELSCICGVCIKACGREDSCDVPSRRTECQKADSDAVRSLCQTDAPVSVCLEPCNETCPDGQRCSFGSCIAAPGGSGGQGGGGTGGSGAGGAADQGDSGLGGQFASGAGGSRTVGEGGAGMGGQFWGAGGSRTVGEGGAGMGGQFWGAGGQGGQGGVTGLSVQCGQNTCTAKQFPATYQALSPDGVSRTALACCTGAEGESCGLLIDNFDCAELGQSGTQSGQCPQTNSNVDPNVAIFFGCCRPDGTCGFIDTELGLGCFFSITLSGKLVPGWCDPPDAGGS